MRRGLSPEWRQPEQRQTGQGEREWRLADWGRPAPPDLFCRQLTSAIMFGAKLSGVRLIEADLSGANLRGAGPIGTNVHDVNLRLRDLRQLGWRQRISHPRT